MRERKINGNNHYHLTFYLAGSSFRVHSLERKSFSWKFLCLCHFGIRVVPEYMPRSYEGIEWGGIQHGMNHSLSFYFPLQFPYSYYIIYFSESSDSLVYSVQRFFLLCYVREWSMLTPS